LAALTGLTFPLDSGGLPALSGAAGEYRGTITLAAARATRARLHVERTISRRPLAR